MPDKIYKVVHSSPEIDTVWKYINATDGVAYNYRDNVNKFLAVIGEDGLTNRQRIEATFKTPEEKRYIGLEGNKLPLKVGTVIYLEYEKINQVSFLIEGIDVVSTDDVAFKAAKLAELEADKGYVSLNKTLPSQFQFGSSKDIYPDVTVWIWCRSLSSKNDKDGELQGEFLDLTPYVQKVTTNMGKNGGNFQISLPPLVCDLDSDQKWTLRERTVQKFENNIGQGQYVSEGTLYELDENSNFDTLRRNQFWFNNAIKSNDLIFIRFETLKGESDQRYKDKNHNFIDKSHIPNRIYDMIGLVDSTAMSTNPAGNDVAINISGRDLSKLFIDDGTYFFALENSQGIVRVAGSTTLKNSLLSRIMEEKGMKFIGLYNFTSIEYILKYIIQQLANIKIVPNELFSAYGERRNKRFNEVSFNKLTQIKSDYVPQFKDEVSNGIWQIVKLVIDKSVSQRRLADTSFSTAQGSLLNFIHSAIQEPLTEFYMDTYGDQYHLIVRKPPYDQQSLISLLEGRINTEEGEVTDSPAIVDIEDEDVLNEMLMMDDTQVYSWYHFFPKGAMINSSVDYSTAIMPAIFFDEYAQIYGSKPFQQSHAYVPYVPMSFDSQFGNLLYEQGFKDIKYVIESNQYLPFTRKGTLVLNGDRRIKIGNVIRYKPTGEIFFVNSVQQNFQIGDNTIDRTTTVHVSRGMIEQFIYGLHLTTEEDNSDNRIFVSYFNLIDTRLNIKFREIKVPIHKQRKVGTKVIDSANDNPNTGERSILDLFKSEPYENIPDDRLTNPEMVTGVNYLESYNPFPENKKRFLKLVNAINHSGYNVILVDADATNRTYARQAALHKADSRNAVAGHSVHEFGEGIDITVLHAKNGTICSKRTSEEEWRATGVPRIANQLGFRWGGNNDGTFGTKGTGGYYIDRVHFQLEGNGGGVPSIHEDVYEDYTEYITTKGIDENSVFQNFKVNKYTFNFFLKNMQFKPEYRQVRNKQVYNSDQLGSRIDGKKFGEESLDNIEITAKRKRKK
jgi:hypothetical protein